MGKTDEETREELRQNMRELREGWRNLAWWKKGTLALVAFAFGSCTMELCGGLILTPDEERYYQNRGRCERLIETLPLDQVPEDCVQFIR